MNEPHQAAAATDAAPCHGLLERGVAAHAHTGAWVAERLRALIAAGKMVPGQKLGEKALSETFGISRNTLREAFRMLNNELIITRVPNRGVFVASPGPEDVREIYAVRRMIEPAAVAWGADLNVAQLHRTVVSGLEAMAASDTVGVADANQRFHQQIVAGSGSRHLQELMHRVLARMRLAFQSAQGTTDFHRTYLQGNVNVVGLLDRGQRVAAAYELRSYLEAAETELLSRLSATAPGAAPRRG